MATLETINSNADVAVPKQYKINLKWPERYVSIISGVKIGFSGFKTIFSKPLTSLLKIGAGGYLFNRGITGHCELYDMMGRHDTRPVEIDISTSVTVNQSRTEVYNFWRKLDNLPLFMEHLKSVETIDEERSRWTLHLPANVADISWEAEIVYDEPGDVIVWQSMPDSVINNSGRVRFIDTPEPNTTLVHVVVSYNPPAGLIGASLAHIVNPLFKNMVENDIRNFKKYMDVSGYTNEVAIVVEEGDD